MCGNCRPARRPAKKATRKAKPAKQLRLAVYLDRDGVINVGKNVNDPGSFELLPGVIEALIALKEAGFLLILVTNQGGLSEDFEGQCTWPKAPLTRKMLDAIHAAMNAKLGPKAALDLILFCPHSKFINCRCRKPGTKMFTDAAKQLDINLSESWMIGDRATDVQAGINAGCTSILVLSGPEDDSAKCPEGTIIRPSLKEAAEYILARKKNAA